MTEADLDREFLGIERMKEFSDDAEKQVAAGLYMQPLMSTNTFVDGARGLPNTRPEKYEFMIHAEANLVFEAAMNGIPLRNEVLLCTLSPCQNCIRTMFQAGIREIYYKELYRAHDINMRDIKIIETKVGPYTKMVLENYE